MDLFRTCCLLTLVIFLFSCKQEPMKTKHSMPFYVGTYTNGESEGIYQFELSVDGNLIKKGLLAKSENPSFLCKSADGKFLMAVNEVSNKDTVGFVSSFKIKADTLIFINKESSGGAHPCHITTNEDNFVVAANYSGGNMGLLKLQKDGRLSELLDVQQHKGKGTHPRQDAPHAHSGWFTASGDLISIDLGTNQLWFSGIDSTNRFIPANPPTFDMEPGAGPRHLALHPTRPWMYVINELTSSVSLVTTGTQTGKLEILQTVSTLPHDYHADNTCADIHVSADGRYLYASNRGHNSVAIFQVDSESGELALVGHESTRGEWPRNFTLSPDGAYLLVANQFTNNIVSFKRDEASGKLSFVDEIEAPTPVCLLFR